MEVLLGANYVLVVLLLASLFTRSATIKMTLATLLVLAAAILIAPVIPNVCGLNDQAICIGSIVASSPTYRGRAPASRGSPWTAYDTSRLIFANCQGRAGTLMAA